MMVNMIGGDENTNSHGKCKNKYNKTRGDNED